MGHRAHDRITRRRNGSKIIIISFSASAFKLRALVCVCKYACIYAEAAAICISTCVVLMGLYIRTYVVCVCLGNSDTDTLRADIYEHHSYVLCIYTWSPNNNHSHSFFTHVRKLCAWACTREYYQLARAYTCAHRGRKPISSRLSCFVFSSSTNAFSNARRMWMRYLWHKCGALFIKRRTEFVCIIILCDIDWSLSRNESITATWLVCTCILVYIMHIAMCVRFMSESQVAP
jgi:hypothetical protein